MGVESKFNSGLLEFYHLMTLFKMKRKNSCLLKRSEEVRLAHYFL